MIAFSIIIPTYNSANLLREAISSVIAQSYPHWKCYIIDNDSEDDTDAVVRSFGDSRLSLLKIQNNGIIASSRNLGMKFSHERWIAFLDSDDIWDPNRLDVIADHIRLNSAFDVFITDERIRIIGKNRERIIRYGPYVDDFARNLLIRGNRLSTSAVVLRREFLIRNRLDFSENPDYVTAEDYDFWIRISLKKARFLFIRHVLGTCVIHNNNQTKAYGRHFNSLRNVIKAHLSLFETTGDDCARILRKIEIRLLLSEAKFHLGEGNHSVAVGKAVNAFGLSFFDSIDILLRHYFNKIYLALIA